MRLLAGLIALGLATQASRVQAPASIVLPVEHASNVFFARTTINGAGPFWLTIDTGATLTVIDPATATRLGLSTSDAGRRANVGVAGDSVRMVTAQSARLQVGTLPLFAPSPLYVISVRGNSGFLGHHIDGVLGVDFLRRHIVEFDYRHGRVSLRPASPIRSDPAGRPDAPSGRVAIALEGNVLVAPATLTLPDGEQVTARLLIDTGSNGALTLTSPFVSRHRLADRFQSQRASASVGINGMVFARVIELRSVAFGQAIITSPNAALSRATSGLHASADFDGIIGAELLRHFRVVIDFPRRRLALEPR